MYNLLPSISIPNTGLFCVAFSTLTTTGNSIVLLPTLYEKVLLISGKYALPPKPAPNSTGQYSVVLIKLNN